MSRRPTSFRRYVTRTIEFLVLLPVLGVASISYSQDAVRPSLAGEEAAEAREQDVSRIPYNLELGPVRFRLSATVGVEYNDNVNYAEVGKQSDWIFTPNVNVDAIWPITQLNTLRLDLGISRKDQSRLGERKAAYLDRIHQAEVPGVVSLSRNLANCARPSAMTTHGSLSSTQMCTSGTKTPGASKVDSVTSISPLRSSWR